MSGECRRPVVPPVAWFATCLWVGAAAGELLGSGLVTAAASAGLATVAGAVILRRRGGRVALVTAGLVAGVLLSAMQGAQLARQMETALGCGARTWSGDVEADPVSGTFGASVRVRVRGGPLDGARVRVGWPENVQVPELGQSVRFAAVLKPVDTKEPWGRRSARAGVCATGNAWKASVVGWKEGAAGPLFRWRATTLARMHRLRGAGADLAEGIVLGDRRRLIGTDTEQDFQVLGLTHLVAVSGSHLALACGAVAFLGTLMHVPRRPLVVATMLAGAAYALVTGMPYSALRSLMMLAVGGISQLIGRRGQGVASLAVAVVAVLVLEPWSVFDIGLQLSVLAVGALLLFGELSTAWVSSAFPARFRGLVEPLSLTLAAQVATVPVVATSFGIFSVLAPLANAIAGPLVSLALLLGLGGAVLGIVLPELGWAAMKAASAVLGAASWLAGLLASLPGAAVAFDCGWYASALVLGIATLLWVWWPLPRSSTAGRRFVAAAVCGSMMLSLGPAPPRRAVVRVLDVGQGDAILVQDGGRSMLVDTGPDAATLRRALSRTGIRRLDAVVLTHAHDDHTGGMPALDAVSEIGWIGVPDLGEDGPLAPGFNVPERSSAEVRFLEAGDSWQLGQTRVSVLWPAGDHRDTLGTNDTSVVLLVDSGEFEMVLTGDAEGHVQQQLLAADALHEVEVLKVPHHGSTNGLTKEALNAWSPQVACISVGTGNDFGHPSAAALAMLREQGVRVARTDHTGTITIEVGEYGYRIEDRSPTACGSPGNGDARTVRETMGAISQGVGSTGIVCRAKGTCGRQDRGSQTGLSHLRRRRVASRARPPPIARPHRARCGSRLQLRGVPGGERRPARGGCRCEHASVRLGPPTRRRSRRRQDGCRQSGGSRRVREGSGPNGMCRSRRTEDAARLEVVQGGRRSRWRRGVQGASPERVCIVGRGSLRVAGPADEG